MSGRRGDKNVAYRLFIITLLFRKTHKNVKPLFFLVNGSRDSASHCCFYNVIYIAHINAVTGDSFPVNINIELQKTGYLLKLHIRSSSYLRYLMFNLFGFFSQYRQIIPEHLNGNIGLNARNKLINAKRNRLCEIELNPGNLA